MVTQGNETQIGLQNFFERYIQLFTCFYQDIMKVISRDHTAKFPNCYFTHLFILNSILNQGYSDPFFFSSLKTVYLAFLDSFFLFSVSHDIILLPGPFIFLNLCLHVHFLLNVLLMSFPKIFQFFISKNCVQHNR